MDAKVMKTLEDSGIVMVTVPPCDPKKYSPPSTTDPSKDTRPPTDSASMTVADSPSKKTEPPTVST